MPTLGKLLDYHDAKQRSKPPTPTAQSSAKRRRRLAESVGGLAIVASAYMPAELDMAAQVKLMNQFFDALCALDSSDVVIFALAPA